jgi:hypothetical protein
MGLSFVALDRLPDAKDCFEKSLALDSRNAEAKYGIILIQEHLNYQDDPDNKSAENMTKA